MEDDVISGPTLTGVHHTDTLILLSLDDKSLGRACQISRYTRNLCNMEDFWMKKIGQLGIPVHLCQDCTTFKESYVWYSDYLRDHGFLISDKFEGKGYVFSNLSDAYNFYINLLRKYSTFKVTSNSVTDVSIFPSLENAPKLKDLYQNTLSFSSDGEIGLYFFEFNERFTLVNPRTTLLKTNNHEFVVAGDWDSFLTISSWNFNIPDEVVYAFVGFDMSINSNGVDPAFEIYKEMNEEIANNLLIEAQFHYKDPFAPVLLSYEIINSKTQVSTFYIYDPSVDNFVQSEDRFLVYTD